MLVVGLEPTRGQAATDFESVSSANSDTPAYRITLTKNAINGNSFPPTVLSVYHKALFVSFHFHFCLSLVVFFFYSI